MKVIYLKFWVRENVLIKFIFRISLYVEMCMSVYVYIKYNVVLVFKVIVDMIYFC